jgi:threonine dehydratase
LDSIVLVSEDEILTAMRFVWERAKLVIEPSAAVALAPLLFGRLDVAGQRVGVILSGGNVDLAPFFGTLKGAS